MNHCSGRSGRRLGRAADLVALAFLVLLPGLACESEIEQTRPSTGIGNGNGGNRGDAGSGPPGAGAAPGNDSAGGAGGAGGSLGAGGATSTLPPGAPGSATRPVASGPPELCPAPAASPELERVRVASGLDRPIGLDLASDGKLLIIERGGKIRRLDPRSGRLATLGELSVNTSGEFGLLGVAVDPSFSRSGWLYLYYTPAGGLESRLSRFTVAGETLVATSELVLLRIPHVLNFHVGGDLAFGPDGHLYLATGANDFAFSALYPGCNFGSDVSDCAKATSANTSDLRGKILRIRPRSFPEAADAPAYTIPAGNLFSANAGATRRPEIYSMGHRNPFRLTIDPGGALYVAEVGSRFEEMNQILTPGNYGWPLSEGSFAGGDEGAPVNDLPGLTGDRQLPPARRPWFFYPGGAALPGLTDPGVPGGRALMVGPRYRHDPGNSNPRKLPAAWDGQVFFWDFSKGLHYRAEVNAAGALGAVHPVMGGLGFGGASNTGGQYGTIDMLMGPDGALYVLELWAGTLWRVDYVGKGNRSPQIAASAEPMEGKLPLTVRFSALGTSDPDGDPITYGWDFDGDGKDDATGPEPAAFVYRKAGAVNARLTAVDSAGNRAVHTLSLTPGGHRPRVAVTSPAPGALFEWGEEIAFTSAAEDAEDGPLTCSAIAVTPSLGHDRHEHDAEVVKSCSGTLSTRSEAHGSDLTDSYYLVTARASDRGGAELPALSGEHTVVLHPRRKPAMFSVRGPGTRLVPSSDPSSESPQVVSGLDDGAWIALPARDLTGATAVRLRVATAAAGARLELHAAGPMGPALGSVSLPSTGGWQSWTTAEVPLAAGLPPGTKGPVDLYLVARHDRGLRDLLDLSWVEIVAPGAGRDRSPPTVLSATAEEDPSLVTITFSERLERAAAERAVSYSLDGAVGILRATLLADERRVQLETAPLEVRGGERRLTVKDVADRSGNAMTMPSTVGFRYLPHPVATGLAALWTFDEPAGPSAFDSAGPAGAAGLIGGAAFSPGGARGTGAVQLDGVDGWLDIPDRDLTGDFAITAWVKLTAGQPVGNQDAIAGAAGAGPDINFFDGRLRLYDGAGDVAVAGTPIVAGRWTHCAVVRTGATVRLYQDGALEASGAWSGSFPVRALGRGNAGFLGGKLDDVRLYQRSLTDGEVAQLASNAPVRLVAHHRLDDGAGLGPRGAALELDGIDDALDIPDLTFGGDFSLAAWVRVDGGIGNEDAIVGQVGPGPDVNFFQGKVRLYVGTDVVVAATATQPGRWTHVTVTRSAGSVRLFVDGALEGTGTYAEPFVVRALGRGNAGFLGGALDDVRFHASALSEQQVEALAARWPQAHGVWSFDDATGTSAAEATGSGQPGMLVGAPAFGAGRVRGGLVLDGKDDLVDIADVELGDDFTVAAWVKLEGTIGNEDALVGQNGPGPDLNFFQGRFRLYDGAGDVVIATRATPAGAWVHHAVTRQSGVVTLYLDGQPEPRTGCYRGRFPIQVIGRGNAGFLGGSIDELHLHHRALRPSEIRALAGK